MELGRLSAWRRQLRVTGVGHSVRHENGTKMDGWQNGDRDALVAFLIRLYLSYNNECNSGCGFSYAH